MKRCIAIFLITLLIMNLSFTVAFASDSESVVDISLFDALDIDVVTTSYEHVTRSEFVYVLAQSVGNTSDKADALPFEDVKSDTYYAGALKYALDSGIVSKASVFYPDNPIKYTEACKMAVSALGLDYYAIAHGGYPAGYIKAAADSNLLKGISTEEYLSYSDAVTLLENLLHSNVHTPSGYYIDGETMAVYQKGESVLSVYHDVALLEGAIVTATPYTGLYEGAGACEISEIEINDTIFKYHGDSVGLIGKNVDVYYKEGSSTKEVIFLRCDDTNTVTISSSDIYEVAEQFVRYTSGKADKRVNLIPSPSYIYNNRARSNYGISDLLSADGTVTFIDSDDDGKYDVVYVMECTIVVAQDIDIYSEAIMGVDNTRINLGSNDKVFSITKGGLPIDIIELQPGDVLQVYSSVDDKVVSIVVSQRENIKGTVTEINTTTKEIYIDSVAYTYSSSFASTDLRYCKLATKVTLALTDSGVVAACIESESKVLYGYYLAVGQDVGLDSTVRVKLFSERGKIDICTLADSVIYNGTPTSKADVYKQLNVKKEQLIRYAANTDNVIRMIDTQDSVGILSDDSSDDDNLTLYQFPSDVYSTIHYITSTAFFHPYFRIASDTVVFRVVGDDTLSEDKRYSIASASFFKSNKAQKSSNLLAYNVKEAGDAGAVLVKTASVGTDIDDDAPGGLVYSVNPAINPQGEKALALVIYKSDTFSRYYIEDEAVLSAIEAGASFSNVPIRKGDYVSFNVGLHSDILSMRVDFKYDPDPDKRKVGFEFDNHIRLSYYYGTPYMRQGDIVSIIPENIAGHEDGITEASQRYRLPLTSSITVYDTSSDTVYEGSLIDIITYTESAKNSGKILVKTDSGNLLDVVYYK